MPLYRKKIVNESSSSLILPSVVKTTASSNDFFIGIDENQELYKIKKSDLFAGLSTGGTGTGGGTTPTTVNLVYSSDGDDKGLFYYLGTNKNTANWQNPQTQNFVIASMSSSYSSGHNQLSALFDRQPSATLATENIPDSWYKVDLKDLKLKPSYYSIRGRDFAGSNPNNWKFQGSKDNINWIDLDIQSNRNLQQNQWLSIPIVANDHFNYFRFLQTGVSGSNDYIFCIGEIELYGELIKPSTTPTTPTASYPTGMALLLEDGSKLDKSGNDRHAITVSGNSPASVAGLDGKQVLKWNGTGTQELEITPFLSSATGATLYCVYTIESGDNYNIVRTVDVSGGDFWKFIGGSAGYFATFLQNRLEVYPASMPATGNILVSIHAGNNYQILVNNDSKGVKNNTFFAGNKFRIGVNDYPFVGSVATLLVYPEYIQPYTTKHNSIINVIKTRYPSLTLVS